MNFEDYLKKSAQKVDEELDGILSDFLKEAKKTDIKLLPLSLAFLNACKGGKRIRGVLVALGFEIVQPVKEEIFLVGAAYEILHTAILAHDDIIDKSALRRDKPSLYKALGGDHYGISQAISLGDAGFFLAMKIISESRFLGEEKNRALAWLNKTMIDTTIGEMLDVEGSDSLAAMKLKTAKYTFCGPLILGAILAKAEDEVINAMEQFGLNLGIAYQIHDDILDGENKLGTLSFCKQKELEYSLAAKQIIREVTNDASMQKLLEEMVDYLVRRTK